MNESNLLIDFNSPAHKNDLALPLIPVPPQISLAPNELYEPSADPFEVQDLEAPDPFECALWRATNNSNSEQATANELNVSLDNKSEQIQILTNSDDRDSGNISSGEHFEESVEPVLSPENVLNKNVIDSDEVASRNEVASDFKVDLENSPSINSVQSKAQDLLKNSDINEVASRNEIASDFKVDLENSPSINNVVQGKAQDLLKNSSKSSVQMESDSKLQSSADFSTEESLKEVIAKRVNRCIQDVLNGSVKTADNSVFKKPQNKRSLSFIGLSSVTNKDCDRLNKSCTDVIDIANFENQPVDASSDTSGFGLLSPNSTDVSTESKAEDQVFREAKRLSRTFSKLAQSFCREQESDSDSEDLISCKPRWYDSSEDEEEKLLKDPALNFRRRSDGVCSSPAPAKCMLKVSDSPALLAYKSRRSLEHTHTGLNNTQEEVTMKRSISMGSHMKEVSVIPPLVSAGPINLMKAEVPPIRLRKNFGGETKKGPLRAVMPVQSMTKEPLAVNGKLSSKQNSSPETRMQGSASFLRTPVKDNNQLNIIPVASSTPNKAESLTDGKLSNSLLIMSKPTNKQYSLEGNFGSHNSREMGVMYEGGARQRSNSASSSIPRVLHVKPSLRGLPLAPKSTSNLARPSPQLSANRVPDKKKTSQVKSSINTRVLTDLKTKSPRQSNVKAAVNPRQSKVKTAVNAISNLVRSKKTTTPKDKENRVPV